MHTAASRAVPALVFASLLAGCSGAPEPALDASGASVEPAVEAAESELLLAPRPTWQQRFDGASTSFSDDYAARVLRTPEGKLVVVGSSSAGTASGASLGTVFVAAIEPATGATLWRRDIPVSPVDGTSLALVRGAAIDRGGNVYVVSLGGQVSAVGPTGALRWTVQGAVADALTLFGSDVVIGTRGGLDVRAQTTGSRRATWAVPTGSVPCLAVNARGNLVAGGAESTERGDVPWLASFGATGQRRWTSRFGISSGVGCRSIAADAAGQVLVAGSAAGTVAVSDALFAAVDDGGVLRWSRTIPGTSSEFRNAFAIASDGRGGAYGVYVGVSASPSWFASSSTRTTVRLDGTGKVLWSKSKGGVFDSSANIATAHEIALDPSGNLVVATEGVVSKYRTSGSLVNEVTVAKAAGNAFVWAGAGETFVSATVAGSAKAGSDVLTLRYAF
jgi:hypothetical protein